MRQLLPTLLVSAALLAADAYAQQGSVWSNAGGDRQNSRNQASEHVLSPATVAGLTVKWVLNTAGDVSATPAVDIDTVYIPDWAGYLYAVNRSNGHVKWSVYLPSVTGIPSITQSPTIFGGQVFVGVASQEEALAAFVPGYELSFRGSMLALDLYTGAVHWKTFSRRRAMRGTLYGEAHQPSTANVARSTSEQAPIIRCRPPCSPAWPRQKRIRRRRRPACLRMTTSTASWAATGAILWSYASGNSCLSGAAIADGTLYWGSGYSNFGFGAASSKLFSFSLPN